MSRSDQIMNGDFDFDGEAKDFRKTIGKACIAVGILFIIFNSYFVGKILKIAIGGESFEANIVRGGVYTVAEYKKGDTVYKFNLDDVKFGEDKKTMRFYYKGDIHDAIAVNWASYVYSYFVYFAILGLGILNVNNLGIKDIFKKRQQNE